MKDQVLIDRIKLEDIEAKADFYDGNIEALENGDAFIKVTTVNGPHRLMSSRYSDMIGKKEAIDIITEIVKGELTEEFNDKYSKKYREMESDIEDKFLKRIEDLKDDKDMYRKQSIKKQLQIEKLQREIEELKRPWYKRKKK